MSRQASEFQYKAMSLAHRGMEAFCESLRAEGYADVRLVSTSRGLFMSRAEAASLSLSSSRLLVGIK